MVDLVIGNLEQITADAAARGDRIGYFSALYWLTSRQMRLAIKERVFERSVFLDRFDGEFASYYFNYYSQYRQFGYSSSPSWNLSFKAAQQEHHLILQHLVLGLNAHILVDLGLCTATASAGSNIEDFAGDFMAINDVLAKVIPDAELRLGANNDLFNILNEIFPTQPLSEAGLRWYRANAWDFACRLANAPKYRWPDLVRDQESAAVEMGLAMLASDEFEERLGQLFVLFAGEDSDDVCGNIFRLMGVPIPRRFPFG